MNDTNNNFIEVIKSTLKRVVDFDITSTEAKILCKVLPAVQCRFDQVSMYYSLFNNPHFISIFRYFLKIAPYLKLLMMKWFMTL